MIRTLILFLPIGYFCPSLRAGNYLWGYDFQPGWKSLLCDSEVRPSSRLLAGLLYQC